MNTRKSMPIVSPLPDGLADPRSRRALSYGVGVSLCLAGTAALCGVAVGEYGDTFWRALATVVVTLLAVAAALAGLELLERRQLVPVGLAVIALAPAELVVLLVANWREGVSGTLANGEVTAVLLLLSGLVVSSLRLLVRARSIAVATSFGVVVVAVAALNVIALPMIWADAAPDPWLQALLALALVTAVGYVATPIAQRLSGT